MSGLGVNIALSPPTYFYPSPSTKEDELLTPQPPKSDGMRKYKGLLGVSYYSPANYIEGPRSHGFASANQTGGQ